MGRTPSLYSMSSGRFTQRIVLTALWFGVAGIASNSAYAASPQRLSQEETTVASSSQNAVLIACAEAGPSLATIITAPVAVQAPAAKAKGSSSGLTRRWNGLHVGFNLGHGSGNGDTFVNPLPTAAIFVSLLPQTLHPNPGGVTGGGVMGLSWQHNAFVYGFEGDVSATDIGGTKTVTPIIQNNGTPRPGGFVSVHEDIPWMISLRPRVGIGFSRFLVYGTGGVAFARVNYVGDTDFRPSGTTQYLTTPNKTQTGWTGGAGAEVGFAKHWAVKGEYLHYDLGSVSVAANPQFVFPPFQVAYTWQTTGNIVRFGLNYHF
jgi:outer membrane immunogenic protein